MVIKMIENLIPQKVKEIEAYSPNLTPVPVRLDANESPFLPTKKVLDELSASVYDINFNRYPDPYATELVNKFAELYGVSADNVTAGNGSDELISLIVSSFTEKGDSVCVAVPDFSMYAFYANLSGAASVKLVKNADFSIDFDALNKNAKESSAKVVIFSNPCNPTGWVAKKEAVVDFIKKSNAIVVVDEAYMEFSPQDESVLDLVSEYDNLIVLKTMSKAYGVAALRLGFMVAGRALTDSIRKVKSPYNVNSVSQIFGEIILSNAHEIKEKIAEIKENLTYLRGELIALNNKKIKRVCESCANFVYMEMESYSTAKAIYSALMQRGVAIRCMSDGYLRITAGTREECDIFLKKFKEVLL